ncbi:hypothetical protein [Methyloterricola oryzae]|uniref:hypothetical protein n=1 Tax=Methyloterricola oryzae TaxID=1495050 RepID=UPI0005EB9509|nr:hypothetical protein [Methyloterricola oryzae]
METRHGRFAIASLVVAFVMLAPLGAAQAQGKSGAHIAAQDTKMPTTKNLSARGSIAMVPGSVPLIRNLSARGSLAQVMPAPKDEPKANLDTAPAVAGL